MKNIVFLIAFICCRAFPALAQNNSDALALYHPSKVNIAERQKFQDMKFGLFIHWGIYSILGDGEWVMHQRNIPYQNYSRLASFFNPQSFNAKQWVQLAKRSGFKYITITTRHHDGFSMFQSQATTYNIVDATPYHHDPLMDLAIECQKQGIELHLYYSLLDWGRPDYGFGQPIVNGEPSNADWPHYIDFMKKQLTELITRYPGVKAIWFDGEWERESANWHFNEIYGLIHQLNPAIMVGNNHHHAPRNGEDFQMFERDLPGNNNSGFSGKSTISALPLETCETINNSWGFNINDRNYKSAKQIVHYLVNAAGRNANFLLNIGPMPNGQIQPEFINTLSLVGNWLQKYGDSIYGTRGHVIPEQTWGTVTAKDHIWYVHVLNTGKLAYIFIPEVQGKISSVRQMSNNKVLKFKQQSEGVFIYTNMFLTDSYDTIIKLQFEH